MFRSFLNVLTVAVRVLAATTLSPGSLYTTMGVAQCCMLFHVSHQLEVALEMLCALGYLLLGISYLFGTHLARHRS